MGIKISEIAESINNIINQTFVEVSEKIGDTPVTKKFDLKNLQDQIDIKANLTQLQDVINQVLERITGPSSATPNNVPVFGDSSGKTIVDSGISLQEIISAPVSEMVSGVPISGDENVVVFDGTSGKRIKDSNKNINDIVSIEGNATVNNVPMFSSQDGSVIKDSGKPANKLVTGPDTATGGNVPVFYDDSGKSLSDSALSIVDVMRKTGPITAGNIPAFTGINGNTLVDSGKKAANIVTGPDSASDNAIVVFDGESGNVIRQSDKNVDDVVIGPTSSLVGSIPLFADESGKVIQDSAIKLEDVLQTLPADAVAGPSESIDGNIAVFDGVDGKKLRDAGIGLNPCEDTVTIYVSDNDEFTSLRAAVEYAIKKYYPVGTKPFSSSETPRVNIVIRQPFVIKDQIYADGIDLSWITITTNGKTIGINGENFTYNKPRKAAFLACNNGCLPVFERCKFSLPYGIGPTGLCLFSGGRAILNRGFTITGGSYPIYIQNGFLISSSSITAGGAYYTGIVMEGGVILSADKISASNNDSWNLSISRGGIIVAYGIEAINSSTGIALYDDSKIFSGYKIRASYCSTGISVRGRSMLFGAEIIVENCGTGLSCADSSFCLTSKIRGKTTGDNIYAEGGSNIIVYSYLDMFGSGNNLITCKSGSKVRVYNYSSYKSDLQPTAGKLIICSDNSEVILSRGFYGSTRTVAKELIECTNGSRVYLGDFSFTFAGTGDVAGVLCSGGSVVNLNHVSISKYPIAIKCTDCSTVIARGLTISGPITPTEGVIVCENGSRVYAPQCEFVDTDGDLIVCNDGSEVYAKGCTLTIQDLAQHTGAGALCYGGSKVNIQNANLLGVGGLVADVGGGGVVYLHGTNGNTSIPVNTFTAAGLIWGDDPTP